VSFCSACGVPLTAAPQTGGLMKRPGVVTLLAVLHFLSAAFMLLAALLMVAVMADEPAVGAVLLGVYLVFGGLSLACGIGLWKLRPWGRALQIGLSIVGLIGFPIGTLISGVVLYYMFRPEVRILFSGRAEDSLDPSERAILVRSQSPNAGVIVAVVLVVALMVIMITGIIAAIAIPNLINAIDRGRQKRSMADMRSVSTAIEAYAVDNGEYPSSLTSIEELEPYVVPIYLRQLPRVDGWETPFQLWTSEDGMAYQIVSLGKDGKQGAQNGGPTESFNDDIVYRNGTFRQWPDGIDAD
jgi:general secretion pathway protein G